MYFLDKLLVFRGLKQLNRASIEYEIALKGAPLEEQWYVLLLISILGLVIPCIVYLTRMVRTRLSLTRYMISVDMFNQGMFTYFACSVHQSSLT